MRHVKLRPCFAIATILSLSTTSFSTSLTAIPVNSAAFSYARSLGDALQTLPPSGRQALRDFLAAPFNPLNANRLDSLFSEMNLPPHFENSFPVDGIQWLANEAPGFLARLTAPKTDRDTTSAALQIAAIERAGDMIPHKELRQRFHQTLGSPAGSDRGEKMAERALEIIGALRGSAISPDVDLSEMTPNPRKMAAARLRRAQAGSLDAGIGEIHRRLDASARPSDHFIPIDMSNLAAVDFSQVYRAIRRHSEQPGGDFVEFPALNRATHLADALYLLQNKFTKNAYPRTGPRKGFDELMGTLEIIARSRSSIAPPLTVLFRDCDPSVVPDFAIRLAAFMDDDSPESAWKKNLRIVLAYQKPLGDGITQPPIRFALTSAAAEPLPRLESIPPIR